MRKLVTALTLLVILALPGCTWFQSAGCSAQDTLSSAVAGGIATGLQCQNPAGIKADVEKVVAQLGLCKTQQVSLVSDICTNLGGLAVDQLAEKLVPSAWNCSAADAKGKLKDLVVAECNKLAAAPAPQAAHK